MLKKGKLTIMCCLILVTLSGCGNKDVKLTQQEVNKSSNDSELMTTRDDFLNLDLSIKNEIMNKIAKKSVSDELTYKGVSEKSDNYYNIKDGKVYVSVNHC